MIVRFVFEHVSEPPLTVGAVGAVRSSLTVLLAPLKLGVQEDVLPAPSTVRNCTWVVPCAVTTTLEPEAADDQPEPALVRYW